MPQITRARAATAGLMVPAVLALGMSADTSYRFLGTALAITGHVERAALCGVAEAAIVALTIYAWATRTKGPAYLAYAAVLVQAVPAFKVSGASGGVIRVVLGPVLLAVLLHLLLGLELRMSGRHSDSIVSAALREMRERLTSRLGIGQRGADSAAIARSRAADKAVDLADSVAKSKSGSRAYRRRTAALADAIDAARLGLDGQEAAEAEAAIVARVVRRKSVASLAGIETRHDWTAALYQQMQGAELPQPEGTIERLLEARKRLLWGITPVMPPKPGTTAEVPAQVPAQVPHEVPAEVPHEVPAVVPAAAEQGPGTGPDVPAEVPPPAAQVPPLALVPSAAMHADGGSSDVPALVTAGSAEVPAEPSTPGRGSATRAVRQLIRGGTTDPADICARLESRGLTPPSKRYIRRLVSEARNNDQTGAYL